MIAGYKLRLNGGAFTNQIIDVGIPSPLEHLYTGLAADTDYEVEIKAYDAWGNESDWSEPFAYTTPAASLIWTNHVSAQWDIDIDQTLTANTSTFGSYAPEVVPRFNNVGDYIEFSFEGVAFMHIFLTDGSGHLVKSYSSGQLDDESGFMQIVDSHADGDIIRIEKISATQFEWSVNGGTPITVTKAFTGEVTAHVDTVTVLCNVIFAPVTNIPF